MSRLLKWRLTQTALMKLLVALIFVLVSCYATRAQEVDASAEEVALDDIALDDVALLEAAEPEYRSEAIGPALRSIEGRNPQSPTELMNAVNILRRLGGIEEAKGYLARAITGAANDEALAQIHADIGTVELVRLANDKSMMPEAREFVFQVFAAAKKVRRDPARLTKVISQLGSEDEETVRVAIKQLSDTGAHSVPALIRAFQILPYGVSVNELDRAMRGLGRSAEDALIAAAGAPNPNIQAVAVRALATTGSKRARNHLIRPSFSPQPEIARRAARSLRVLGSNPPPSVAQSASYLNRLAQQHLDGNPPIRAEYDGTLELWTWSAEQQNVIVHRLTSDEAAAVTAARFARDAYELSPTYENQQLLLISQLQADQMLGGMDNELSKAAGTGYDFGKSRGVDAVTNALASSLDKRYDAAAIGACELIGDLSTSSVSGSNWTPLTKALQSPSRRVRHAAAKAIMKIDPRSRYAGASYMLEALVDLADAGGVPRAVVASPYTTVRNKIAGSLGGLGFGVYQANEANACLKEALRVSDYDVVVLSDSTSCPTASEAIQQLRKSPRGKMIPVILLVREGREEYTEALANLDDLVITMPEFGDEQAIRTRLDEVEKLVGENSVPPAVRLLQARDALDWLGHFAEYSKTYPMYDVVRARDAAIKAVGQPALRDPAINLLGYLGDEESQKLLVAAASRKANSAETRQRAANAFGRAVVRRGMMLRKAEVQARYDRYNASEAEDKQTQEILGQLLDIIETQTKPTTVSTAITY